MSLPFVERTEARRLRSQLAPVAASGTARAIYRAMVTDQITPTLAGWGILADGEEFVFPSRVWHLRLAFVSTSWSTANHLQFDVNVVAVPDVAWSQWRAHEPQLPDVPDAHQYYAHDFASVGGLMARLGDLQDHHPDRRWSVRHEQSPTPVAADVLTALRRTVLPEFAGRAEASPLSA